MSVPNRSYLDPATSVKVGNLLAAAGEWQVKDVGDFFRKGLGFGSPAILDQVAATWQNLVNNQVQDSVTAISNANNIPSWSGAARTNYTQYLSKIYPIITGRQLPGGVQEDADPSANMEFDMTEMVNGLHSARDACYAYWWACIGALIGAATASTLWGGIAGAAAAILEGKDAVTKTDAAGDDFTAATHKPVNVGDGPEWNWPEPGTDQSGHETFNSTIQP